VLYARCVLCAEPPPR